MATTHELGLRSLTHLHNNLTPQQQQQQQQQQQSQPNNNNNTHSPNHQNPSSSTYMWNPNKENNIHQEQSPLEDESWEVRAFAEDTASEMGTTWPPRSYTCAFCRREFRSAQALGGHMNVHRRDRARLHQVPSGPNLSSHFVIPAREIISGPIGAPNGSHCLVYQPPGPPSTILSMSAVPSSIRVGDVHRREIRVIDPTVEIEEEEEEVDLELRLGQGPTT